MATIVIERPEAPPSASNIPGVIAWLVKTLGSILKALNALVTLDSDVRDTRTRVAERAVVFFQSGQGTVPALSDAAVLRFQDVYPDTLTQYYTTALIVFDENSGSARWRMDGQNPTAAGVGMPIPTNGYTLTITGALNISSFAVIGETGQTLTMSVTLFK